jgi:rhodanese-related sulfurtransferase
LPKYFEIINHRSCPKSGTTLSTIIMFGFLKKLFASNYETLDGKTFKARFLETGKNAMLIDVRTKPEFQSGHIKGSKNINLQSPDFSNQIGKLAKDKIYFIYCRSGARSARACSLMANQGLQVYNLSGGIGSWK